MTPKTFYLLKRFIKFYGPSETEFKAYLRETRKNEDDKMKYITMVLDYWFVEREKLKSRSRLHYHLLI